MPRKSAVIALALVLVGCSGSVDRDDVRSAQGGITGVTVSGTPGEAPRVRLAVPLEVTETRSEVLVRGTGAPIAVDQLFVLQLSMYDARTGAKAISTYDKGRSAMAVKDTDGTLFPALTRALAGVRQGSRVVLTTTPEDGYGAAGAPQYGIEPGDALVLIADVVAVPPAEVLDSAEGLPVGQVPFTPEVGYDAPGVPSHLVFSGARKPSALRAYPVIEGDGPKVRDNSLVTLHTLSQVWGAKQPFDNDFGKEPILVPIGVGEVVRAWDEILVGKPRGTRLVITAPPEYAFGSAGRPPSVPGGSTVAYVVDIVGVS